MFVTYLDTVTHTKKKIHKPWDVQRHAERASSFSSSSEVNTHTNSIGRHQAKFTRAVTEYSRAN